MAFLTIGGEAGCRVEEIARLTAQLLGFELVTEARVRELIASELGSEAAIPDKAWPAVVTSLLAQLGTQAPLVVCVPGAEMLFKGLEGVARIYLASSAPKKVGAIMVEHRLDRPAAKNLLAQLEARRREEHKGRFGAALPRQEQFDLRLNLDRLEVDVVPALIQTLVRSTGLDREPLLSPAAEAQIQFQMRLQLAKFGISPPSKVAIKHKPFANDSEKIFANLLDFYRIAWEYEPRSFPIQLDKDGRVLEAFTPDFYLPEFDLYVELTTMKQAHVTKKNRKVKLLRAIYPHINIQVFYQKDFRNLIFKYGLADRTVAV